MSYGGGGLVPRNDLQRLPKGFDSPRLHTYPLKGPNPWPENPFGTTNGGQRPRQEHPMWQAVIPD